MVLGPLSLGASAGHGSGRSNLAQSFCPGAGTARQRAKAEQKRRRRLVKTGIFLLRHKWDSVTTLLSGPQNVSSAGFPQPPPPWRLWPGRLLTGGSRRKPDSSRSVIRFGAGARQAAARDKPARRSFHWLGGSQRPRLFKSRRIRSNSRR